MKNQDENKRQAERTSVKAGADTETLVETAVGDIRRAAGDRFTDQDEEWFTTILNNFAASVVTKVLPEDKLMRAEVLRKAREAGIDIDHALAPGV